MTLDEAIAHALEVAEQNEFETRIYDELNRHGDEEYRNNSCQCAADHRQLAEWLTELKELREEIGSVKLSNMKEALTLIRTLKAELNGQKEDPFSIIAEVCRSVTDCRRCQWYEKCPFSKNYESYPEEWRD